jgi:hypothetical protein
MRTNLRAQKPTLNVLSAARTSRLYDSIINMFSANEPGFVYDNNDFVSPTAWRTNMLRQSQDWSDSVWTKTNITAISNAKLAPDGTMTGNKLTITATAASLVNQVGIIANSSTVTASVLVHQDATNTNVSLLLRNGSTATNFDSCLFNPVTGALTGTDWSKSGPDADGWYTLSYTRSTGISPGQELLFYTGCTGSVFTAGLYWHLWGAQINAGTTRATYQNITDFNTEYFAAFPNTTLFADVGGTGPAMLNGPVGLQYDKRLSLTQGADARTSAAIGIVGVATAATWDAVTGAGSVSFVDASNQSFVQLTGLTPNAWYRFKFSAASTVSIRSGTHTGSAFASVTAPGQYQCPASATGVITITRGSAGTSSFTITEIKSVAGLHRYQGTAAARPTLRGTPTGANAFTGYTSVGAGWVHSGGGTITATAATENGVTNVTPVVGRTYYVDYSVVYASGTAVRIIGGGANGASHTASGTFRMYFTATTTGVISVDPVTSFTGSVTILDIRDVTYDVVSAPYGLQADGVDDGMITATADFTGTDAVTLCVGMRKLSDAAVGRFVEFSPTTASNNGSFGLIAPNGVSASLGFASKGTAVATAGYTNAAIASPVTLVATGVADISTDTCLLRINGAQVASDTTDQGTGNYGSYVIYSLRRGGSSNPFNGLDFGGVCLGRTATTPELMAIEAFVRRRTPV